jgi:hypothetical protein
LTHHRSQPAPLTALLAFTLGAFALALPALGATSALAAGPPLIAATSVSHITETSALLEGAVEPNGKRTEYRFEYVTDAVYQANPPAERFAGATGVPVPDGSLPAKVSGSGDISAGSATVSNLLVSAGAFAVGQKISGPGSSIPANTTIASLGASELTLSKPATATIPGAALSAEGAQPVPPQPLAELGPGTTYRFRLLAHSTLGETASSAGTFATFAVPPLFGPCPNEALRAAHPSAGLPDCRAYEQATPPDKNGADAGGNLFNVSAALSGGAVTFITNSGVPGGVGSQEYPIYASRRGADGWSTEGLLPPPSFGDQAQVTAWTPDLAYAFDIARLTGSDLDGKIDSAFLSRTSADGSFGEIVPYTDGAGYRFVAASADDSKVFFEAGPFKSGESAVQLTPDAAAGEVNLYRYDRDTHTLGLVGLLPAPEGGGAPPGGSFAGPYDWWGEPPSLLRGGATADYFTEELRAISSSGDSAYFTAGKTGQIYLRKGLDGPGPQTLHVSASEKTNGPGPGTDPAGTRPAAFMGAGADGSTAFFTSPEKLTNDANTGPEPALPSIGRADIEGSGPDLSFLPAKASGIAVDSEHVYWANPEAGTIGRAKLNGGGVTEVKEDFIVPGPTEVETEPGVFESLPAKPRWVAVDGAHVYWTNDADGKDEHGTIGRAELGGGDVKAEFIAGASNPQGIAVDGFHVYWANGGSESLTRGIGRADVGDGGEAIQPWSVDLEGNPFGFSSKGGVTLDSTYLYFTDGESGNIERIKLAEPKDFDSILFTGTSDKFQGIAVVGSRVYWANSATNAIGRAKLNNPEPNVTEVQPEWIKNAAHPLGLAVSAANVYWSANQGAPSNPGNDLYRFEAEKPAGERLTDLTVDHADTNGAEVKGVLGSSEDGSYLYFAANGDLDGSGPASAGDCTNPSLEVAGACNLYLSHAGDTTFIARLDASGEGSDAADWQPASTKPHSPPDDRVGVSTARVSPDGQTLLFRSKRRLTAYDNEGVPELYRFHLGDPDLLCVSCSPGGVPPVGPPTLQSIRPALIGTATKPILDRVLSADGDRVFFETPEKLVGADTDGEGGCPELNLGSFRAPSCQDVYEWEAQGSGSCHSESQDGGCLYLLSTGKGTAPSFFADASASGSDVFLFTRDSLVPQDRDRLQDVYDVRTEGGLASQNQPPPSPPCEGEACREGGSVPAGSQSPGSAGFSGPVGPKPNRSHKRKHRKRKHHHRVRHHRKAQR